MNAGAEATPVVNPVVGVEDISKGVRVDIYDETQKRWFPLCARSAPDAYGAPGAAAGYVLGKGSSKVTVPVPSGDEGYVSTVVTGDSTPNGSTDMYLQETLFRWTGWSLIGSRPGKTLGESPDLPVTDQPGNPPAPNSDFPVQIDYVPTPGTLPLLRFGRTYRARARVADIGGGGVGFDKTASSESFAHATGDLTYGRFEPVPSPVLLMRHPVSEGERLERLVIRSNYDIPDDKPGASHPRITPCARHVVPPAMAELLAEHHGMFDHASGLDATAYDLIKAHANAVIGDVAANRPTSDPNLPSQQGKGQTSGLYYDTDNLSVPYLPDVLSRSAALQDLPGAKKGATTRVLFSKTRTGLAGYPAVPTSDRRRGLAPAGAALDGKRERADGLAPEGGRCRDPVRKRHRAGRLGTPRFVGVVQAAERGHRRAGECCARRTGLDADTTAHRHPRARSSPAAQGAGVQ